MSTLIHSPYRPNVLAKGSVQLEPSCKISLKQFPFQMPLICVCNIINIIFARVISYIYIYIYIYIYMI